MLGNAEMETPTSGTLTQVGPKSSLWPADGEHSLIAGSPPAGRQEEIE